jgi:hypothetical protein
MRVEKDSKKEQRTGIDFGNALAIGLSLGLVFGTMLGNIAMGISAGLLLATLANAIQLKIHNEKNANLALLISAGALVLLAVIWLLST